MDKMIFNQDRVGFYEDIHKKTKNPNYL